MRPTIYYAGISWRGIAWSNSLNRWVGMTVQNGELVILSWDNDGYRNYRREETGNLPLAAAVNKFAHLIQE